MTYGSSDAERAVRFALVESQVQGSVTRSRLGPPGRVEALGVSGRSHAQCYCKTSAKSSSARLQSDTRRDWWEKRTTLELHSGHGSAAQASREWMLRDARVHIGQRRVEYLLLL